MEFNYAADVTYGLICFLCFLIGTLGNMVSFFYFTSKKRDISNVIYMMITANDMVISIALVPIGISFWSERQPGFLFGNKYGCITWRYLWGTAISLSILLVICLNITRTVSLLDPFRKQKVWHVIFAVIACLLPILARPIVLQLQKSIEIKFFPEQSRCDIQPSNMSNKSARLIMALSVNLFRVVPMFVVATSCAITAVLLRRRNENVQPRSLQKARNRATVTILLFALLYGVCNIPYVVSRILLMYSMFSNNMKWHNDLYEFDTLSYFSNGMFSLLLAANSAANPILYFWRMPRLRDRTMTEIGRLLGRNREIRRSTKNARSVNEQSSNTAT